MTIERTASAVATMILAAIGVVLLAAPAAAQTTLQSLAGSTHFHGIAIDPGNATRLLLATHHGLYAVSTVDGSALKISSLADDLMSFTPHPSDPSIFYSSGHAVDGSNLGVIMSQDGGASWRKLADGVNGPVEFDVMDVSKADARVMYGVHDGLQRSDDGGETWTLVGPEPVALIDLAASTLDADTLYAATEPGLAKSADGGQTWSYAYEAGHAATLVQSTDDGELYIFVFGEGLLRAQEADLDWQLVSDAFQDSYVLHLAATSGENPALYVVAVDTDMQEQGIYASRDDGQSWTQLGAE